MKASIQHTILTLSLISCSLPAWAEDHSTGILPPQQPVESIRSQRPWLIEFGGTFPKLPGLGLSYNLNEHVSLGLHGSYLYLLNSLALTGRYYFSPEASSLYAELDVIMMTSLPSSQPYMGLSALLGYEYRSDNGFTMGAGVGIVQPLFTYNFGLLPALSFTLGHAF
jgi:hypothetical protein